MAIETTGPVRTTAAATLCAVVAAMPAFLTGASAVFLREELGFDERGLGAAVAVFFAAAALASVAGGRLCERIGAGRALVLVAVGSAAVMLGVATLAASLTHLTLLLAFGGVWHGVAQPATNLALARGVVVRPAFTFGVKQAAIPATTLLAGASVPLVSVTLGWRWAFALGAVLSLGVAIFVPSQLAPARARTGKRVREGDAATAPLVALAVAVGVGTAAAVALGSFLVESVVAAGMAPGTAGWLLVTGSVAGIVSRLVVGWLADRQRGRALYTVSAMLLVGAAGYGLLALGGTPLVVVGALLAYAFGWGWTGLLMYAIARLNPNAPAAATGIAYTGAATGSALGPLAFGIVVSVSSFQTAWALAAAAALVSAVLVLAARMWLVRDRDRREAAR